MRSFVDLEKRLDPVPAPIVRALASVERSAGREDRYRDQVPALLDTLAHRARIESIRASNAIEDIVVDPRRLEQVVRGSNPRNRPEADVLGYRDALDHVLSADLTVAFGVPDLLRLHRLVFSHTDAPGGRFKDDDNTVIQHLDDGTEVKRFRPVSVRETPFAVSELHHRLHDELERDRFHPILVIGAYAFDLLMIHPFGDGNGRTSRLATTWLLLQSGFEVARYVAIEGLVDRTSDDYYAALRASTENWHEGQHDLWPWLAYLVERVAEGYRTFDELVHQTQPQGSKAARIEKQVMELGGRVFTKDDVRAAHPDIGDATITRVLQHLRDEGRVRLAGRGPNAHWERLEDP